MIDFIDPVAWPAFNVADSCIVVGVFALLYVVEGLETDAKRLTAGARRRPSPRCVPRRARGGSSRAAAQRLIEAGAVSVDGSARAKNHRLAEERVELAETGAARPSETRLRCPTIDFEIVHRDEHLLVIDKPAGVVTHPRPATVAPRWLRRSAGWRRAARIPSGRASSTASTATPRAC